MRTHELADMLREVPGTEVTVGPGLVTVHLPAIGDTTRIAFRDVLDADWVHVPTGAPAVQVDLKRGRQSLPLIVTVDDVVFTPAYADDVIDPADELLVPAMPSLIGYSEMHRDVRSLGRALDDPKVHLEPTMLAATLTAHRCFLAGAVRVGFWPVRVAAWWEYTSARSAGQVRMARFRDDPEWDELMAGVQEARAHAEQSADAAADAGTHGWDARAEGKQGRDTRPEGKHGRDARAEGKDARSPGERNAERGMREADGGRSTGPGEQTARPGNLRAIR